MKKLSKRPATDEEVQRALQQHIAYLQHNGYTNAAEMAKTKLQEALDEGYKNETCECGLTFLAFHHYTTCKKDGCPFSDGVSLLDRLSQSIEDAWKEDKNILAKNGWSLDCQSPFEISHSDGSRATGQAAQMVLDTLKEEENG